MNELSHTSQIALQSNHLSGISLGHNCPPIHSFLFADDLLICGKATAAEACQIKEILSRFCQASGQTPNWAKSSILMLMSKLNRRYRIFSLFL